jgi:large subunit ribosomal protein L27
MAHTKSGGSTKLGRDSESKRLGIKLNHGQEAKAGQIIVRQRGAHVLAGVNVRIGADDTLYAAKTGTVNFKQVKKIRFDGSRRFVKRVSVVVAVAK